MTDLALNNESETVFTLTQALQLVGLVPSLFVICILLPMLLGNRQTALPIGYFMALGASFALPLIEIYPILAENYWLRGSLLAIESLLPAFGFLLICQFIMARVPPWAYWLVLTIPLLGGGTILYASIVQMSDACRDKSCMDVNLVRSLYHIISSSFIFLLLFVYFTRSKKSLSGTHDKRQKYWLIIALIALHLFLLAIDLLQTGGYINLAQTQLIEAVLRLSFIYLILTSLLRVFYPNLVHEVIVKAHPQNHNEKLDMPYIEKLNRLLNDDKIYREMRLNRAALAAKLDIGENYLSRLTNHYLGKSFNELINSYRIEEAKTRLLNEPKQSITAIGFEVGFNSIASFNRVFKEKTGLSPTEFKSANN